MAIDNSLQRLLSAKKIRWSKLSLTYWAAKSSQPVSVVLLSVLNKNGLHSHTGAYMANPNFGDLMKQAQQLQSQLTQVQEEAAKKIVTASAGGNMVIAEVSGRLELVSLKIDPVVLEGGDVEMIQDLVLAAVNQGIVQAQQMMAGEMSKLTGGLKIPGLTG
jgi:DNA-binding YbaB/EbfC family protein